MDSLPGIRVGARFRLPREPQVSRILRWTLLGDLQVANVRMHGSGSGGEGAAGSQEDIPQCLHPNHRIRQQASSAVHQFHCLQATRRLSSLLSYDYYYYVPLIHEGRFVSLNRTLNTCFFSFLFFEIFLSHSFQFLVRIPMEWLRIVE
ncbi:uncharacterized protein LOC123198269 [Mangifera indica]|uniref:uncharacterized protein LOC123198269 n=1 Tax=Mangifera indica TaxID=29780 RepID=UPI001CFAB4F5|nr:uncharacterized protein LOC123198269 [Mangifera indica]